MAFHTIWSVDLGKSALKAVKLRRDRNNVEILAIDKVDYPLSANGVDAIAQAKEALSVFRARNEVKEPLVVAHPGQGTFSRFIKVPAFDPKKVKEMVRYEASQQIPFPLDEVIWDYHVIHREYLPGEEREIGLFAVRKEAVDDYLVDFVREGLAVEMLSIGYLGLLNFIKYDINPTEPSIVLDIGATHTDLVFIDGDKFWIRPLPHSGNDISKAIMARFKLDFPEAEKLKIESSKAPKQAAKIFQTVIQPKLQELVQEVHRSIGYYRSQAGEVKFARLYLLGNGSKILGIKKFLEDRLVIPVEIVSTINRFRMNRDVNVKLFKSELASFGTALGCGLQAVGAGTCQVDLIPKEEKIRKEIERKKKHVFFAAGVVLLFILVAHLMLRSNVAAIKKSLARVVGPLKEVPTLPVDEVRKLEKDTGEKLKAKMNVVESVGRVRQGAIAALRTLEAVLAKIPLADHVDILARADDAETVKKAVAAAEAKLGEKLWIPQMSINLVQYPEAGTTGAKAPASGAASRSAADLVKVPAYRVRTFVVLKARAAETESNADLQKLFEGPLKIQLRDEGWTKRTEVMIAPGTGKLESILYDPAGTRGTADALLQQGRPYYGAVVEWYMLPELPPERVRSPADDTQGKTAKKQPVTKG